jgi:hypothetical protein
LLTGPNREIEVVQHHAITARDIYIRQFQKLVFIMRGVDADALCQSGLLC